MLIRSKESIQCDDCRKIVTPEQVKSGEDSIHKTREGAMLCECCYEDFTEKNEDYN